MEGVEVRSGGGRGDDAGVAVWRGLDACEEGGHQEFGEEEMA